MSNADELITDIREARRFYRTVDPHKTGDVIDAADRVIGLWDQLDDHMSTGGPPPIDWPFPPAPPRLPDRTKTGRVLTDNDLDGLAAEAERGYEFDDGAVYYTCGAGHRVIVGVRVAHETWCDGKPEPKQIRYHSSDDMTGLGEFDGIAEPVAVVIRPDGSIDAYGYIAVVDQRSEAAE